MKRVISLLLTFTLIFTSLATMTVTMNVQAAQEYVEKFNANFTEWTLSASGVTEKKTFTNPSLTSNTMFITTAGALTPPAGYPTPSTSVEVVNKADLASTYPLVAADTTATAKLAKYTQTANIGMFRMRGAYTALTADTSIRVTFRMFITDICTKGVSYDTDGTTVLEPVKDTAGTVKELNMTLTPQKATSNCGTAKSITLPVNQWVTVSEILEAKTGADGVRLSIGGSPSNSKYYTCNFASTIFFDGNFKIEVLEDVVAPTDGDYTMIARFNPGDSTMTSTSKGSGTALFSENTVSHAASNGHASEPAKQTDTNGKFKTATSTLDTQINPSTLSSTDYPGIADTKVSSSGLIARLNRTAACSMIRFKDIIDTGIFAAGDRFKMKAWVYLADTYSRGEYETLNEGSAVTDTSAEKDPTATTAKIRYIYCTNSKSTNADGIMKTFTLEVNKWHQIEIEGTVNDELEAVGVRIDQASDCYGSPYAGTWFLGDIEMYHADKLPERNSVTNWQTLSNVDFESETAAVSGVTYAIDSSVKGSIQTIDSLVNEYPQSEIGTAGLNVYKYSMNNSADSKFKINTIFDSTKIAAGDVIRISADVFPADHTNANAKTAKVRMFLADNETSPIADDKRTSVNLKLDAWQRIAFTYTASEDDISATQGVMIDAAGEETFANTLILSDIKTEVYKAGEAIPTELSYTEDFEGYSYSTQTHINTPHYRTFGSGGGSLTIGTTSEDLSGMVPASGTNALGITGRGGSNIGIKINDVFQGLPVESDVGKTFRISVKVYADKSAPLYKDIADSAAENTTALTDEEKETVTETAFKLCYGGPDGSQYKYRTAALGLATAVVPFNTWTTITGDLTITSDMLDDGSTESKTNPLISSIRIDQTNAKGGLEQPICNTFYIDDLTVSEVPPAQFTMPKVFGSNMVFQRNMPFNIWGFATEDGKEITATLGTQTKTTTSKDGRWTITFDAMDTARNLTLTITSPGEEDIEFTNIAIGEVILTAGQSNMNAKFSSPVNAGYEDALEVKNDTSVLSDIRFLTMPKKGHLDLQEDADVKWEVASASNITSHSAVGYTSAYFLAKEQNIPVGIIEACTGGLTVEAFMDLETLKSREMYKDYYITFYETQHASGIDPDTWKYYPTGIYNTMLHPLKGMTIGSCVWYQGGNNRAMAVNNYRPVADYEYLLYDYIHMLRKIFNNEDMPFVVCEQANLPYNDVRDIRQIQLNTIMRMNDEKVYFVSTSDVGATNYDVGIENMLHPSNKVPVGKRAAHCIMADKFGYKGEYSSPLYENMTVEGNKAILTFSHADGLKQVAKIEGETEITGFEISADGENYVKANAELGENNTVIVSADTVSNPTTVRYCYNTFTYYDAEGNLCSGNGISESKFRTTYVPEGCVTIGHLGGNLYNGADLPLPPFIATVIKPTVTSYTKETKDDKIHYTVELKNTGFSSGNPQVIAAVYTDGQLKLMKAFDTDFETQDIRKITDSFDASIVNADSELKFFLWDGFDNLKPFESAKTLTFK